mmetsp:Transcript_94030/g.285591  ORF Transcript_94030/g.285591 Transcript_94030/m.285591 type:complete len:213 (-) Transcript_94030:144-782(-)
MRFRMGMPPEYIRMTQITQYDCARRLARFHSGSSWMRLRVSCVTWPLLRKRMSKGVTMYDVATGGIVAVKTCMKIVRQMPEPTTANQSTPKSSCEPVPTPAVPSNGVLLKVPRKFEFTIRTIMDVLKTCAMKSLKKRLAVARVLVSCCSHVEKVWNRKTRTAFSTHTTRTAAMPIPTLLCVLMTQSLQSALLGWEKGGALNVAPTIALCCLQ